MIVTDNWILWDHQWPRVLLFSSPVLTDVRGDGEGSRWRIKDGGLAWWRDAPPAWLRPDRPYGLP